MKHLKIAPFLSLMVFAGCAHPYSLSPMTEKPEHLNGIALNTDVTEKCVLQAGSEYSNKEEMLVKVRVRNKSDKPITLDPTTFTLSGNKDSIRDSVITAQDPDRYLKDLENAALALESRTKMESYQGISDLGTLKDGEKSDKQIDAATDIYKKQKSDAEVAGKEATVIRQRMSRISTSVLRKATLKSGEHWEGALIFKNAFEDEGVVTLETSMPECPSKLQFMLKK